MMMNKPFLAILFFFISQQTFSQTNDLSSSPYSLYGLGLLNNLSTGKSNTMGKTGIASPFNGTINTLNPASFASINPNSFLYEVGVKIQRETLVEEGINEPRNNANFSGLAFAFPLTEKLGMGLTLLPYTNVGYFVRGVSNEIEGSTDTYLSDIYGSGGLNSLKANFGYSLNNKFRVGLTTSFLFGKIAEDETNYIDGDALYISEENFYSGIQFTAGMQYDVNENFSVGTTLNIPTSLKGDQELTIYQEDSETNELKTKELNRFKLPLEVGLGLQTRFSENLLVNVDYKKSFWNATGQSDQGGDFINNDFIGLGLEYVPNKNSTDYWKRVMYRTGVNYDNGNLEINNDRIKTSQLTLGLGLPFNKNNNSMLNIGYSYGQQGILSSTLIQEKFHLISINLSLENSWFQKILYD